MRYDFLRDLLHDVQFQIPDPELRGALEDEFNHARAGTTPVGNRFPLIALGAVNSQIPSGSLTGFHDICTMLNPLGLKRFVVDYASPFPQGLRAVIAATRPRVVVVDTPVVEVYNLLERIPEARVIARWHDLRRFADHQELTRLQAAVHARAMITLVEHRGQLAQMAEAGIPAVLWRRGINLERFRPGRAYDPRGPVVFFGRYLKAKGAEVATKLFERALARGHRCAIVGPLGDEDAKAIPKGVLYCGSVTGDRLLGLYREAALVIHPGIPEGNLTTAQEALACGIPALVYQQPAADDQLPEWCPRCQPGEDFGDRALELLGDPEELTRLSELARQDSMAPWGYEIAGEQLRGIVSAVLNA